MADNRNATIPAHGGRDVLDLAESVLSEFGDAYFKTAGQLVQELPGMVQKLRQISADTRTGQVEHLTVLIRRIQLTLEPMGASIARHICADLAELLPRILPRLIEGDDMAQAALESYSSALGVALRKRLMAPSKPVAAGLLRNLAALRTSLLTPPKPVEQVTTAPMPARPATAPEAPRNLWQSLKKIGKRKPS